MGNEPKLPGFENYTNYQLFFIAYGNVRYTYNLFGLNDVVNFICRYGVKQFLLKI